IAGAWREYARIQQECQQIYQEALQLITGLVLRDHALDWGICNIADTLVKQCAGDTRNLEALTVPALQEALTHTLGYIIRLRFPEWSVWTLPLVVHEFGHVLLHEKIANLIFQDCP